MKIIAPENIFTRLLFEPKQYSNKISVLYLPAKEILMNFLQRDDDLAFIPAFDIFNTDAETKLLVSKNIGISFQAELSNMYLYFAGEEKEFRDIAIIGDYSDTEIMFSKVILQELYRIKPNIIPSGEDAIGKMNCVIVGDTNLKNNRFLSGLNMAEQGIEILKLPFTHYLLVGKEENTVEAINDIFKEATPLVYEVIENNWIKKEYSDDVNTFFKQRIPHIKYNFSEADLEGLSQLLRYPFFYGQTENIIDIDFI